MPMREGLKSALTKSGGVSAIRHIGVMVDHFGETIGMLLKQKSSVINLDTKNKVWIVG